MENKDNINFSGFPGNDPIDIPDPETNTRKQRSMSDDITNMIMGQISNMNYEDFKKMVPENILNELTKGKDDSTLEEAFGVAKSIIGKMDTSAMSSLTSAAMSGELDDDDLEELLQSLISEDDLDQISTFEDNLIKFNLAGIDHIKAQPIGNIPVKQLTQTDIDEMINNFHNIPVSVTEQCLSGISLDAVTGIKLEIADPYFAVFETVMNDPLLQPFYMFGVKDNDDKLSLYIPSFMNVLNLSNDGTSIDYFNKENDKAFYDPTGRFFPFNMLGLVMGIKTMIVPIKKTLMSPALFGDVKNTKESITGPSQWLRVGKLISNESAEAILLKKDADLDVNETEFNFYFRFNEEHDPENLQYLQDIIFKTNLNGSALLYYSELKYKNGFLYIDVDFGDF